MLSSTAHARAEDWLSLYPTTGELVFSVDSRWTDFDTGTKTRKTEYEERLRLRLSGYSLAPQIFNFTVKLEPALEQERSESGTQAVTTDTSFLDYGARFSFLHGVPASPVTLRGNFERSTVEADGSLGSRSDSVTESRGADLQWKFTPFPSTLSYSEVSLDESFFPGFGQPVTERDHLQKTLAFRGVSTKMQLYLDHVDFNDRTVADNDYESDRSRLNNRFDWGKNSSLTSRLGYFHRQGFNPEERVTVDESVRLQHTEKFYTTYGYGYESLERTTNTETHRGELGLHHRLYSNLDTTLRFDGSTTESDQFQENVYNGNLDFNYTRQFRPDLRVTANLGGGYGVTDRTGGQLDFTETAVVPSSGIIVLTQRFIILSTIVVTAPGCSPCIEGPLDDYEVQDAGGDFTQLFIRAGSRINIGDTITVDYSYQPPTAKFSRIPYRVGLRLDYDAFAFYHRTTGENQNFISGPDPSVVGDRRTDTTGVSWNWSSGRNRASAGVERVYSDTISRSTTEYILYQSLTYGIAPRATLNARLGESFLKDTNDADSYNADLAVRWVPTRGVFVTPRISAFRRIVDPGAEESFMKAGVDARWLWRRLSTDFRYDHTVRSTDGFGSTEDRVFVELTRKF